MWIVDTASTTPVAAHLPRTNKNGFIRRHGTCFPASGITVPRNDDKSTTKMATTCSPTVYGPLEPPQSPWLCSSLSPSWLSSQCCAAIFPLSNSYWERSASHVSFSLILLVGFKKKKTLAVKVKA
ncbi:hypothetical protein TcCL_Unassigned02385 [Trypanosoma cruzi]|nr:hypothetical protein TcCL_Unassigned02385 [Trypanosoma cruzi]